jgi:hypothetical protein
MTINLTQEELTLTIKTIEDKLNIYRSKQEIYKLKNQYASFKINIEITTLERVLVVYKSVKSRNDVKSALEAIVNLGKTPIPIFIHQPTTSNYKSVKSKSNIKLICSGQCRIPDDLCEVKNINQACTRVNPLPNKINIVSNFGQAENTRFRMLYQGDIK